MKPRRVIDASCLPLRMPLLPSIVLWLLLDRLQAPGFVWGIVGTIMALLWISWVCCKLGYEESVKPAGFGEEK